MSSKSHPAVIVGLERNGLGVSRALESAGVPAIAIASGYHPAHATRSCRVVQVEHWTEEEVIVGLEKLGAQLDCKAPLLITRDDAVLWISDQRGRLQDYYELYLPSDELVQLLMSKAAFTLRAQQEGWPIPTTGFVGSREELHEIADGFPFPCVLKPQLKTDAFRRNSPRKAFKVQDPSELRAVYDLVAQWEKDVVVQEWIGGGDERVAFCLSYVSTSAGPSVFYPGRKLRQWPVGVGNTVLCEPAPPSWEEPITKLTKDIWQKLGFQGLGSVEYKMRAGSDEPVIMEPTVGRTNYQNELAVLNGINIPAWAYVDLTGHDVRLTPAPSGPVKLVHGSLELRSSFRQWRRRGISLIDWLRDRSGPKQYMLWRRGDSGPLLASMRRRLRILAANSLELVLGKKRKQQLVSLFRSAPK